MTELEARAPFEKIAAHNKELCTKIARPDFDGDQALDPTINQAQYFIHTACEVIVLYPQGAFPLDFAEVAVTTTKKLLAKCRARYGTPIVKPMEQAFNSWFNLWCYAGPPIHPPEIFTKRIFQSEQALLQCICDANVKIATKKPEKPKEKGEGRGGRGPQTAKMRTQFERFEAFLVGNPISEIGQGKTVGARANQFWATHRKTFERAALATGQKRGYPNSKAIASAYRTSKN